jgi:hypothetical protein
MIGAPYTRALGWIGSSACRRSWCTLVVRPLALRHLDLGDRRYGVCPIG